MTDIRTVAIVGAGHAGGQAAKSLRDEGFDGRIVLVGEEARAPYERPPLSKQVLKRLMEPEKTMLLPEAFYRDHAVELQTGTRVDALDRKARRVLFADGRSVPYDRLLLTTGARARPLPVPGAGLTGVHTLRTIADTLAIREALAPGASVVLVGGGYIGLEVAASANAMGCRVTVLETQPTVMARVVAPEVGQLYEAMHRARGVDVRTGVTVTAFEGDGHVRAVRCADGTSVGADVVVVGIGSLPNVELAQAAGLNVDNGIVVDGNARTSDPAVFAAGDVTNQPHPVLGRRVRLESWQNAQNQAIAAARAMLGHAVAPAEVPWFWTDQFDTNLQMVGMADRWDRVVLRGNVEEKRFTAFYLAGERVVAVNVMNSPRDVRPAKQLVASGHSVRADALADAAVPLKALAAA